jgi:ribosomal protein L7/L12
MADLEKIVEELGKLSVLEAADLVKMLEEKWGVSAAAPVAAMAAPPPLPPPNPLKKKLSSMSSSKTLAEENRDHQSHPPAHQPGFGRGQDYGRNR